MNKLISPEEFLQALQQLKTKKAQANLCGRLIQDFKKARLSPAYIRNRLTLYRNKVREWQPDHFILQVNPKTGSSPLALAKDENDAINQKTEQGVKQRLQNLLTITDSQINRFVEAARNLITKGLEKQDEFDLVLGICAATACRPGEAARAMGFEKLDEERIIFSAQAKTRGQAREPIQKPVLVQVDLLLEAVDYIAHTRPEWATKDATDLNRAIAGSLSIRVKKYFDFLPIDAQDMEAKLLRSIAAEAIFRKYGKGWEQSEYTAYILGHKPATNSPTRAYRRFKKEDE